MKLSRNTYEIYLVDYLDGKLDAVQVSELLLFLEQNPDLKEEFEGLRETAVLNPDVTTTFDSSSLKKPEYNSVSSVYEPILIAQLEGDITAEQQKKLAHALTLYPELEKDARLFTQTKLQPDAAVVFSNKSQLKVFVIQSYYKTILRVAAVLLLISFAGLYFSKKDLNDKQTATTQPALPVQPEKTKQDNKVDQPATNNDGYAASGIPRKATPATHSNRKKESVASPETTIVRNEKNEHQFVKPNYTTDIIVAFADVPVPAHIKPHLVKPGLMAEGAPQEEYTDIKTWLVRKFRNETNLKNDDGLLAKINKATRADLVIEKDTTTGKITRFEIAGMGLVQR